MALYDRILVPTDGSDGVERAISHAVDLATVHGATVHAVYVVNSAGFTGLPMEASWEGIDEMLRADAEAALATVRDIATARDIPVETHVLDGSPQREIVRYAEEEGCDLVVMGTHGRGGIDRLLLGSVAEKVVRASNVPVMTVRVGDEEVEGVEETGEVGEAEETEQGEQGQTA
ncbi:Nucleotide-binding universal stress protein, UspA family [Halogranum gelatinilyticum]|uniref:Nucleotide-binding universal stress protein, UspA family n=1 Tax=Halogranum gelatinilyticum TaxID=660521 RepID=A0A1G9TBH1_9EURY|nr:universal stress protein [Halogranum gelatinilyticum]SDM45069.1 Nucleotide-binding universal stress protein, UspA family [Halogranum gelatinilyticum]